MKNFAVACALVVVGLMVLGGCIMGPELQWVPTDLDIYDAKVSDITTKAAVVTWLTNGVSLSRVVVMNQDIGVSNTLLDTALVTRHRISVEPLRPSTSYLLLIQSSNLRGGSSFETGVRLVFQTPAQ